MSNAVNDYAQRSVFDRESNYVTQYPWLCFCQCGGNGIVFVKKGEDYRTAFFEAFPRDPDTFIRGEGKTVAEAEEAAWTKWQKILSCPRHEFDRKNYTSGAGVCVHCGLFMMAVFLPAFKCSICGTATDYSIDKQGRYYCKDHYRDKLPADWTPEDWFMADLSNSLTNIPTPK